MIARFLKITHENLPTIAQFMSEAEFADFEKYWSKMALITQGTFYFSPEMRATTLLSYRTPFTPISLSTMTESFEATIPENDAEWIVLDLP